MKNNALKNLILENIFVISKQPVLFRDLLEANCLFNEGMLVDPAKLNFKFRYARTYLVYGLLCFVVFFILLILTHHIFAKLDFHLSIVSAVAGTSAVSKELIKKAWSVHFPYFSYEKYSTKVEMIYNEAVKNEIPRKDLEQYVLERLVAQSEAGI